METTKSMAEVTVIEPFEIYRELSEIEFHFLSIKNLHPRHLFNVAEYLREMKRGALKAEQMANSGAGASEVLECIEEGFRISESLMFETKRLIEVVFSDSMRYGLGCRNNALEMGKKVEKMIKKYAAIMPADAIE